MWFVVCRWPQSQEGDWARPNLCKLARHGPWPVRKRFIRDRVWRGRWKPLVKYNGVGTMGTRGYIVSPQVQDLYPLYLPSQRCGLCQNFKQTTLTTRFYKVRTNLYPHLRKRSDAPVSIYTADKKLRLLHKTPTENLPAGSQNLNVCSEWVHLSSKGAKYSAKFLGFRAPTVRRPRYS